MLAAKSTCKDRWRQILTEADRIPEKHLCTLEPGISAGQMAEMGAQGVRLVVPRSIQASYVGRQISKLISLGAFLDSLDSAVRTS
jgi:hypothetical protein